MAKNIEGLSIRRQDEALAVGEVASGDYTGTFTGPLHGNADTASSLAAPFTVTFTGDAAGSFTTSGKNANARIKVTNAASAEHAAIADTAKNVTSAQLAQSATHATNATYAAESGKAATSELANKALESDSAVKAGYATSAGLANEAKHAEFADKAAEAERAERAEHAAVADALANPKVPVAFAELAEKALLAEKAQYDCMGRSFVDYYALKSELKPYEDCLTIDDADSLYVKREDQLLNATVRGKAYGSGVVEGNTLKIHISSIAKSCIGNFDIYEDVIIGALPKDEVLRDTTKVYIDLDRTMWWWDNHSKKWFQIYSPLDPDVEEILKRKIKILADLIAEWESLQKQFVTLGSDQRIDSKKTFTQIPHVPIADLNVDEGRCAASVHNVRDVRDMLRSEHHMDLHKLYELFEELTNRVDAQQSGDILVGYKNYSLPENWGEMVTRTVYLNFLDEDKLYIQMDPETHLPMDQSKEIVYIRSIIKSVTGAVTWTDKRASIDPKAWVPWDVKEDGKRNIVLQQGSQLKSLNSVGEKKNLISLSKNNTVQTGTLETAYNIRALDGKVTINGKHVIATDAVVGNYLPLTGGVLTGNLEVPDIPEAQKDGVVFNSKTTWLAIEKAIRTYDNNLNIHKYMPKAGGIFTGEVYGVNQVDIFNAEPSAIPNVGDVQKLIDKSIKDDGALKLEILDLAPSCDDMEPNILYSVPFYEFVSDSEIQSIRVEPDDARSQPNAGEGVIYGTTNVLD